MGCTWGPLCCLPFLAILISAAWNYIFYFVCYFKKNGQFVKIFCRYVRVSINVCVRKMWINLCFWNKKVFLYKMKPSWKLCLLCCTLNFWYICYHSDAYHYSPKDQLMVWNCAAESMIVLSMWTLFAQLKSLFDYLYVSAYELCQGSRYKIIFVWTLLCSTCGAVSIVT